jgi:hypothetical protein
MTFLSKLRSKIGKGLRHRDEEPRATEEPPVAYTISENRELRSDERQLVEWLLEHGIPEAKSYAPQLTGLHVVAHCGCGCPTIDLAVGGANATTVGQSHVLADFYGATPEGIEVGVILHGRQGKISELEVYPLTETPASLPTIESLHE